MYAVAAVAVGVGLTGAAQAPAPFSISGRVIAARTGEPVARARVQMHVADAMTSGLTDDAGRFRLLAHQPGRYRLSASASGYLSRAFGEEPEIGGTLIAVRGGEALEGFEIALERERRVAIAAPAEAAGAVEGTGGGPGRGVPAVDTDDEARRDIAPRSGARVFGIVDATGVGSLTVRLSPAGGDRRDARAMSVPTPAHGPFVFPAVPPGRYRLQAIISPSDYYPETREPGRAERLLASITIGGDDVTDRVIDVPANRAIDTVRVTVTDTAARLSGFVRDAAAAVTTAGAVVVASSDPRDWTRESRRVRVVRADTTGFFDVTGLPAGRYVVAHVDRLAPGQLTDPAFLERLMGLPAIVLAAGQQATLDVIGR